MSLPRTDTTAAPRRAYPMSFKPEPIGSVFISIGGGSGGGASPLEQDARVSMAIRPARGIKNHFRFERPGNRREGESSGWQG